MSDVEILYKALEFTCSMTYKTTTKYQPIVFPEITYIISEMSQFKCKWLSRRFNRILHSHFSFYRGTPIIANKKVMHPKTANGHMQTFHTYIISTSLSSESKHSVFIGGGGGGCQMYKKIYNW